ncbi:MAG: VOC family protein [Calditrichaeota bacterium]|nr:VOC family protein [Calditrichota bacterium]
MAGAPPPCSLHHVEIYVRQLEACREFWDPLFARLGWRLHQEWPQGVSFIDDSTGAYLVFVQAEARFARSGFHRCRPGLNHLAFRAESQERVFALKSWLESQGISMLYEDRWPYASGTNSVALFFEDQDRLKVEVVWSPEGT